MLGPSSLFVFLAAIWCAQNVFGKHGFGEDGFGEDGFDLPNCAFDCALTTITSNGCPPSSTACICGDGGFLDSMAACVASACSGEDEQDALNFAKSYCAKPKAPAKKLPAPSNYQAVAAPVSYSPAARPTPVYPIHGNTSTIYSNTSTSMSTAKAVPTYHPASSPWANYSSPTYKPANHSSPIYKSANLSSTSCTSSKHAATETARPTTIVYHTYTHHGSAPARTSTVKSYVPSNPSQAPVSQPTGVYYTSPVQPQITTTLSAVVPKMPVGTAYSSTLVMNATWTLPTGPVQTAGAPSLAGTPALGLLAFGLVAAMSVL